MKDLSLKRVQQFFILHLLYQTSSSIRPNSSELIISVHNVIYVVINLVRVTCEGGCKSTISFHDSAA